MSGGKSNLQNRIYGILLMIFLVLMIVFIGRHLWSYLHKPYQTETVTQTVLVKEIALDGFFVRDESVVEGNTSGILKYNYADGRRVKTGSELCSIYSSQQDQINLQLAEEYKEAYSELKALSSEGSVKGSRIDIVVKQAAQLQLEYVAQLEAGEFAKAKEIKEDLTYQLNKLQLCKGEVTDYNDAMEQLKGKIESLNSGSKALGSVTAPKNGYFSSRVDGLEGSLSLGGCEGMTVADAADILSNKTVSGEGIGKIVVSNYWYYCALADTSELTKALSVGRKVALRFNSLNSDEYALSLIGKVEEEEKTLLIFQSSIMNKDFINARFERASITVSSYEGVGVSKQALRFQDGVKGVYILRGTTVLFKKLDPAYEDEDIIISRYTNNSDYVSPYDNVIVGGEIIHAAGG